MYVVTETKKQFRAARAVTDPATIANKVRSLCHLLLQHETLDRASSSCDTLILAHVPPPKHPISLTDCLTFFQPSSHVVAHLHSILRLCLACSPSLCGDQLLSLSLCGYTSAPTSTDTGIYARLISKRVLHNLGAQDVNQLTTLVHKM